VIFVFDSPEPADVTVYPNLDWARESLESLDVAGDGYEPAFTATGQVVQVSPSDDLFATFEVTVQSTSSGYRTYSAASEAHHAWQTIPRPMHRSG